MILERKNRAATSHELLTLPLFSEMLLTRMKALM
jgi:hypothetical protein